MSETNQSFVELERYPSKIEADLTKSFLESHGITVQLVGAESAGAVLGESGNSSMLGGVNLRVAAGDLERARAILEQKIDELNSAWGFCPKCKSQKVELAPTYGYAPRLTVVGVAALLAIWLSGKFRWAVTLIALVILHIISARRSLECKECGQKWSWRQSAE